MVPTLEALTPVPTVGVPEACSGRGQLAVQAPKDVRFGPESFLNRYTVRPRESTRMLPRLPFATSTVAVAPPEVPGVLAAARTRSAYMRSHVSAIVVCATTKAVSDAI